LEIDLVSAAMYVHGVVAGHSWYCCISCTRVLRRCFAAQSYACRRGDDV
jgi:hypothetical protein